MATENHKKRLSPAPAEDTGSYAGPDRRRQNKRTKAEVTFDAKGNPVWQLPEDVPARRADDETIVDLVKCLDNEMLALMDESEEPERATFDPYDTADD